MTSSFETEKVSEKQKRLDQQSSRCTLFHTVIDNAHIAKPRNVWLFHLKNDKDTTDYQNTEKIWFFGRAVDLTDRLYVAALSHY